MDKAFFVDRMLESIRFPDRESL